MQREGDAVRKEAERLEEALAAQVDRVQATLEARQRQHMQQMFDALNRTAEDILTSTFPADGGLIFALRTLPVHC